MMDLAIMEKKIQDDLDLLLVCLPPRVVAPLKERGNLSDLLEEQMHRDLGLWDADLFDYGSVYGAEFSMDKAARLEYHQTAMTHAMMFTVVDVVDGVPRRWRVENVGTTKWGTKGSS